jgi:hypothetical protein
MRYDNDVHATVRDLRTKVTTFLRSTVASPRRSAALGLAAAVGTGGLLMAGAAGHTPAHAAPRTDAAMITHTAAAGAAGAGKSAGGHGRAIVSTKPAASTSARSATTGRMLHTTPVAGLDRTQMRNAALIVKAGRDMGMSERGQIVAMSTAMQESNLYNRASYVVPESLKYDHQGSGADYDSVGLFQQRYTTGWGTVKSIMNPEQSAGKFYQRLAQVDGWQNMPVTVAAQTVQGSAFPDAYAQHQANATQVVHAINNAAAHH